MVDQAFGNWLAGFIDGEGCFFIAATKRTRTDTSIYHTYRPIFSLAVRDDDTAVVLEAKERTGIGSHHFYVPTSGKRVIRWMIQSHSDCLELRRLLTLYPLRAKKRNDFTVWSRAVDVALTLKKGSGASCQEQWEELKRLKIELAAVRSYA